MDLTYPVRIHPQLSYAGDTAYYVDLIDAHPFCWSICEFDENMVPSVNYGPNRGIHRNKTFICQWALANLNAYLEGGSPYHLQVYKNQISWLRENLEFHEGDRSKPLWYNHFDFVHQNQVYAGPWTGGLGHSLAISLLIRDYRLRKDRKSLELAIALSWFLMLDVEEGGIFCREEEDVFFEEYNRPPFTRILDGLLFILLTVYDLYDETGESSFRAHFEEACNTLQRHLSRWDFNSRWSYYDIHRKQLSNPLYHALNHCLLHVLGHITGRESFLRTAEQWQMFVDEPDTQTQIHEAYFQLLLQSCWRSYKDPRNIGHTSGMESTLSPRGVKKRQS